MPIPVYDPVIKIFSDLPVANLDTYQQSLPLISKVNESRVIVLYKADMQNIGFIDNSASDATASYSKEVTTGFTFTATQTISTEASIEFDAGIVKGGVKMGFSLTFSEQWSRSTTETITFTVPPGKKAFTYQGYIRSAILVHDNNKDTYSYESEKARLLTPAIATTNTMLKDS